MNQESYYKYMDQLRFSRTGEERREGEVKRREEQNQNWLSSCALRCQFCNWCAVHMRSSYGCPWVLGRAWGC